MSSRYSLVIFDCDGVLVDSGPTEARVRDLLLESGIKTELEELTQRTLGMTEEMVWAYIGKEHGLAVTPALRSRYRAMCYDEFETSTKAVAGAEPVLAALKSVGVPFCVASNGPIAQMQITLRVTGLLPYFDGALFSADDVARPKPAPDLFLHAVENMGYPAAATAVVEDSARGVEAGLAAGLTVFQYVGGGVERAPYDGVRHVGSMSELPEILGLR